MDVDCDEYDEDLTDTEWIDKEFRKLKNKYDENILGGFNL